VPQKIQSDGIKYFMPRRKVKLLKISEPQMGYALDFGNARVKARPFIKWAGGKSQLLPKISDLLPPKSQIGRYFEPFLGGGAVFFHLQHPKSFLSDTNQELVELYEIVKNNVEELIKALKVHKNEHDYFYEIRAQDSSKLSAIKRAARFIYLNKTCFNGLYRVNSKGGFNVPFGRYKNPAICDAEGLRASSMALKNAKITHGDFQSILAKAKPTDFIYFDPPYQPLNKTSSFTSYTSGKFGEDEQKKLANIYKELAERGCFVMLSNSDTPLIRELYKDFYIYEIQASRAINSNAKGRGKITELLVINYYWVKQT
jgi:DNA adenine methylase